MKPNPQHAYGNVTCFTVVTPFVDGIKSALKIELSDSIKSETAIPDVLFVLRWIVSDAHSVLYIQ